MRIALALAVSLCLALPAAASAQDDAVATIDVVADTLGGLDGVEIAAERGVVHLTGSAADPLKLERLVEIAGGVDGVVAVVDDVTVVAPEVSDAITPVLTRGRDLGGAVIGWLPLVVLALLVFLGFWSVARVVRSWDAPFDRITGSPMARTVVQQGIAAVVLMVGLVASLEVMNAGAVIGAVLGTAGVFGLAIGFALQDLVSNYIAGMLLGMRRPFALGDVVEVAGHTGKVTRLTMRETEMMTFDGNHVSIPNASVFGSSLTNFTRNPRRRFDFVVGVGPGESLVPAMELAVDVLRATKGVLEEPAPTAVVEALGDWTVNIHCYAWVDQAEAGFMKTKSRGIRRVKEAFDEAGIDMPNPTYVLQQPDVRPAPAADATAKQQKLEAAREAFVDAGDETASAVEDLDPTDAIDATIAAEREQQGTDLLTS